VEAGEHVPGPHLLAQVLLDLDPGGGLHGLARAGAAGAEPPGGHAHSHRVQARDDPVLARPQLLDVLGGGQRGVDVPALGGDHRAPGVHGAAVGERGLDVGVAHPGGLEHLAGERAGQLDHVGGAAAGEHLERLAHLEAVAGGAAERGGHVGQQRDGAHARVGAEVDHGAGELAGVGLVLHEGARAGLDVEGERGGALGDLLGHDRGGDQRDRLDGAGDVAQGVELLVRRGEARAGRADHGADVLELAHHLLVAERGAPAGDRLELVEGAAGVAEPAPGQLRDGDAVGGDQRGEREGDLVPDPAGGVLVGGGLGEGGEVHPLAAGDHRGGPVRDLLALHAAHEDRHGERRHLLLGDDAAGVGVDHPVDLGGLEPLPVALGADDVDGVEGLDGGAVGRGGHDGSPGVVGGPAG
jgi:hypothetical protein